MLLHACCAPCSTVPVERLKDDFEVTLFFYNPNIYPESEYLSRRHEIESFAGKHEISLIIGDYDRERWSGAVKGHERDPEGSGRCILCYRMRLETTAGIAVESGFDSFCTTLTLSPHKNAEVINRLGYEIARKTGVDFMEANFKKKDGFLQSVRASEREGLYRQDYCGCEFSIQGK